MYVTTFPRFYVLKVESLMRGLSSKSSKTCGKLLVRTSRDDHGSAPKPACQAAIFHFLGESVRSTSEFPCYMSLTELTVMTVLRSSRPVLEYLGAG